MSDPVKKKKKRQSQAETGGVISNQRHDFGENFKADRRFRQIYACPNQSEC
jgi:hypothetical protein